MPSERRRARTTPTQRGSVCCTVASAITDSRLNAVVLLRLMLASADAAVGRRSLSTGGFRERWQQMHRLAEMNSENGRTRYARKSAN
eukprot:6033855-Prymnesium_polylepis.2